MWTGCVAVVLTTTNVSRPIRPLAGVTEIPVAVATVSVTATVAPTGTVIGLTTARGISALSYLGPQLWTCLRGTYKTLQLGEGSAQGVNLVLVLALWPRLSFVQEVGDPRTLD